MKKQKKTDYSEKRKLKKTNKKIKEHQMKVKQEEDDLALFE